MRFNLQVMAVDALFLPAYPIAAAASPNGTVLD
jgi:hypothetical protein